MAVLLSAVNPKNLVLTVGAAAAIAQTGIAAGEQAIALAVFVLIGTLGVGVPLAHLLRARRALEAAARPAQVMDGRQQHRDHGRPVPVIGAKLLGDGISGL